MCCAGCCRRAALPRDRTFIAGQQDGALRATVKGITQWTRCAMTAPGQVSLRKGRHSLTGHYYHVTMVTSHRSAIFLDYRYARAFGEEAVCRHGATQSFVVMPDHVHWLLRLDGDLSQAVRLYKAKVSIAVGQSVWDDGFHDHALRAEEDIRKVARYIVANPIRAGLVDNIGQYPYWDAVWL